MCNKCEYHYVFYPLYIQDDPHRSVGNQPLAGYSLLVFCKKKSPVLVTTNLEVRQTSLALQLFFALSPLIHVILQRVALRRT